MIFDYSVVRTSYHGLWLNLWVDEEEDAMSNTTENIIRKASSEMETSNVFF